jgi:hypothetical protein
LKPTGRQLFASLLLITLAPVVARAADGGAWTLGRGEWYSEIGADRAFANAQFLPDARDEALPFGLHIQSRAIGTYNEIGWKKNVSLALQLPFRSTTFSAGPQELSVSGLSDLSAGLRFRLRDGTPAMVFDIGWKAPLGYEKDLVPALGNGRQEGFGALNIGVPIRVVPGFAQASRGFRFVGQDGILIATTTADIAFWLGSRVLLGAHYADFTRISSPQGATDVGATYTAGPILVVRVDNRADLIVGSLHDWAGRGSLRQNDVYVALSFKQSKLNRLQGFLGTQKRP